MKPHDLHIPLSLAAHNNTGGSYGLAAGEAVRVLHVRILTGSGGGPDKTILNSPRHLADTRYQLSAAYIVPRGHTDADALRHRADSTSCPLHVMEERGPFDPATPIKLAKLCRRLGVTIWHAHDYKSNVLGLLVARLHRMRLITTAHGWTDESPRMRFYGRIDRLATRFYHSVIAVSQPIADQLAATGTHASRITLIPNAIDLDQFHRRATHRQAKSMLGINPHAIVAAVVGRMSHEKGLDRLIQPMRLLRQRIANLHWLWVGDGPERASLEQLLEQAGLRSAVIFTGWKPDTRPYLEAADLVVLPSRTEGLPNTALEAMALGVPVAAAEVGGLPDLLDHGSCGLILGPEPASWHTPIAGLLTNPAARSDLAAHALEKVTRHYSFTVRMQRIAKLYDQLLKSPSSTIEDQLTRDIRAAA